VNPRVESSQTHNIFDEAIIFCRSDFRDDVRDTSREEQRDNDEAEVDEQRSCEGGGEVLPEHLAGEPEHLAS